MSRLRLVDLNRRVRIATVIGVAVMLAGSLLVSTPGAEAAEARPQPQKFKSAKVSAPDGKRMKLSDESRKAAKKSVADPVWPKVGDTSTAPIDKSWGKPTDEGFALRAPKAKPDNPTAAEVVITGRTKGAEGPGLVFELTPTNSPNEAPKSETPEEDSKPKPTSTDTLPTATFEPSAKSTTDSPAAEPTPQPAPTSATPPDSEPVPAAPAPVEVQVNYADFATAYGGGWADRLRLTLVDDCVTTGGTVECKKQTPIKSTNNSETNAVTGEVPADAFAKSGTAMMSLSAEPSSDKGDYTATPLAASSSWSAGGQTGDFSWSYPIGTPPGINGPAPSVAINYSSGSVDGRTASTNNQTSWIGEGFSLDVGFVERSYVPCNDDKTDSNAPDGVGDLCWRDDNLTMSLGGKSSKMIRVGSSQVWRSKEDDGTKIQHFTGASNDARGGEYWVATTTDGTRHYFGANKRFATDTAPTNSVSTVPVYGNQTDEPCHGSTFSSSRCQQAWRWGLDYVIDTHSNTMTYSYTQETNKYGANKNSTVVEYDRAANLKSIEYGTRYTQEGSSSAPAKVTFTTSNRCITGSCSELTESSASDWQDVPFDQICSSDSSCPQKWAPTFFSTKRLTKISTHVWDPADAAYDPVDEWQLQHSFPQSGDGTDASLWLNQITRTGKAGTDVSLPPVMFTGSQFASRVDKIGDGIEPFIKWRVVGVRSEAGGMTSVDYSDPDPACTVDDALTASQVDTNTRRCFPSYYTKLGETAPQLEFFHKYIVDKIIVGDATGTSPSITTDYVYSGNPAWHYDESGLQRKKYTTWNDWRGYSRVSTRVGGQPTLQTNTETLYLRGMDNDRLDGGGRKNVMVTDTDSPDIEDKPHLNGFERRITTTLGPTGAKVDVTVNEPWMSTAHASEGGLEAHMVDVGETETRTRLASGGDRTTKVRTTFDDAGLPSKVEDFGDTSTASDNLCTVSTYVHNGATWIIGLPASDVTTAGDCGTAPSTAEDVVSASRTYYDGGALNATPTKGDATKSESASGLSGGSIEYQVDATTTYDSYGRPTSVKNALDQTSTTDYSPATGVPTLVTNTNALGHESKTAVNRAWGSPDHTESASGAKTDYLYDSLGRVTSVWAPGRDKAAGQSATSKFTYTINTSSPSVVRTDVIRTNTTYNTAYSFFDGLLRESSTQTPAAGPAGGRLVSETRYDERGWVESSRGPTFNSSEPAASPVFIADNQTDSYTHNTYDLAGRVTVSAFSTSGVEKWRTTTTYGGDRVSVKPPAGATATTTVSDARGRTTKLQQYLGAEPTGTSEDTTYTYTASGKPKTITNSSGTEWTYGYDVRGRQTSSSDPDKGASTTAFDVLDRPVLTTDAEDQKLWTKYDALGRKTELRDDSSTGTLRATWLFDTIKPGLPTSSTRHTTGGDYVNSVTAYDTADRPTANTVSIPASEGLLHRAGGYVYGTDYNTNGTVQRRYLPNIAGLATESVSYLYDAMGNVKSFGGMGSFIAGTIYSPYGEVILRDLGPTIGKAVYDKREYEPGTHRLTRHSVTLQGTATTARMDLHYTYDAAGNIKKLNDVVAGDTDETSALTDRQCFNYDHLRRMTAAYSSSTTTCAAPTTANMGSIAPYADVYGFDKSGNRTGVFSVTKSGSTISSTLSMSAFPAATDPRPHAVSSIYTTSSAASPATETFTYDDNGSTTARSTSATVGQTITWDREGHEASVTDKAGKVTSFVYDADGNRIIKRDGLDNSTTLYMGETELKLKAGAVTGLRNYSVAGEAIVTRVPGALKIVVGDHQSSGQIEIDGTTQAFTKRRFTPFGDVREAGAWTSNRGFVNKTTDTSTGTTHLGAREYDPALGRFLSVDPIMDPLDPQQMNGYAYANNSPVTMTDPDGLKYTCSDGGGGGCMIGNGTKGSAKKVKFKGATKASRMAGAIGYNSYLHPNNTKENKKTTHAVRAIAAFIDKKPSRFERIIEGTAKVLLFDSGACEGGFDAGCGAEIAMAIPFFKPLKALKYTDDVAAAAKTTDKVADVCRANSFTGDTPVLMADGTTKPIKEVDLGEMVLAADPVTGERGPRKVVDLIRHGGLHTMVAVRLADHATIDATDHHPFWVASRDDWVDAIDLAEGDVVVTAEGHELVVTGVGVSVADLTAFNLTVDGLHTYFAGDHSVLVHNAGCSPADLNFAKKVKLNPDNPAIMNRGMSVQEFVSEFRQSKVLRELPGEFLEGSVEDALKSGNSTVRKLLTDGRWAQ